MWWGQVADDRAPRGGPGERGRDRAQLRTPARRVAEQRGTVRGCEGRRIWTRCGAERACGASWLAVAGAAEARELRDAGLREVRVLVMGALSGVELKEALAADGDVVVWSEQQVEAVGAAGGGRVHVKLDSGMGRLGTRDPVVASRAVAAARNANDVQLVGLMTHFATADDLEDDGFFATQLGAFTE